MKVRFFAKAGTKEPHLAAAFKIGVEACGDSCAVCHADQWANHDDFDVAVAYGVKSLQAFRHWRELGKTVILMDKGYIRPNNAVPFRSNEYARVAINSLQPTDYLMKSEYPHDRFDGTYDCWNGGFFRKWRKREMGKTIIIGGSSEKYHNFNNLEHPTLWANRIVRQIRAVSDREIIYRPKPSWKDAVRIPGATLSTRRDELPKLLERAHCLITHGSNICVDALRYGVPSIILGNGVTAPISATSLDEEMTLPSNVPFDTMRTFLWSLAHCQWTINELAHGEAWPSIRQQMEWAA